MSETDEELFASGDQVNRQNYKFVSVGGSYKTGSTAVIDLLREYHDVCVIDGEFKPLEGDIGVTLKRIAGGESISNEEIGRFERGMKQYGTGSVRWERVAARLLRRLQSGRFGTPFKTGTLARYGKTSTFDTKRAFKRYVLAATLFSSDLRSITRASHTAEARRNELIRALQRFFVLILEPYHGYVPVLDQFIKPGNLALAGLFPFARIIVVMGDPRDQFCDIVARSSTKAKYRQADRVQQFISEYAERYRREGDLVRSTSENVLSVHFEDLVYRYHETKTVIEQFLDLNPERKSAPIFFQPERASENTRLFVRHERPDEIRLIAEHLKFRLYDFDSINT